MWPLTWTPTLYKDKTSYYQSYGFFFWSTYNLSFTCLVVGISSKKIYMMLILLQKGFSLSTSHTYTIIHIVLSWSMCNLSFTCWVIGISSKKFWCSCSRKKKIFWLKFQASSCYLIWVNFKIFMFLLICLCFIKWSYFWSSFRYTDCRGGYDTHRINIFLGCQFEIGLVSLASAWLSLNFLFILLVVMALSWWQKF